MYKTFFSLKKKKSEPNSPHIVLGRDSGYINNKHIPEETKNQIKDKIHCKQFKELHENNSETNFYPKIKLTFRKHSYYKPSLNFAILQLKIRNSKPERKILNHSKHSFKKNSIEFYITVV